MNHRLALPNKSNHLTQKIKIVGHHTRYIDEQRRKNPRARIPETAFPEPYLLTETENTIIMEPAHNQADRWLAPDEQARLMNVCPS